MACESHHTFSLLTEEENSNLKNMLPSYKTSKMLYKATLDGFTSKSFHEKSDGKTNTVTIIKNNLDYVFGGFTSKVWTTELNYGWIYDPDAFIFSVRRKGTANNEKFKVNDPEHSVLSHHLYGPSFGHDILIIDESNTNYGSYCNLGDHFELPQDYKYGEDNTSDYLAGKFDDLLTSEIEVHQLEISNS